MRSTRTKYFGVAAAVGVMAPLVLVALGTQQASAHGAMQEPISRSYACYLEGPENPTSQVCRAVVDVGGPQPLYDWMEVNIADAAGRHREIIPDGELCSAGREKYAGLDLARDDWPATELSSGADYTFRYHATAPHAGGFEFYITKDAYDQAQPLGWDDLEAEPFLTVDSPEVVDGYYTMPGTLPEKSGRHLIYAIWQRTDSPEAFYSCSDVEFDSSGDGTGGSSSGAGSGSDGSGSGDTGAGSGDSTDADRDHGTCNRDDVRGWLWQWLRGGEGAPGTGEQPTAAGEETPAVSSMSDVSGGGDHDVITDDTEFASTGVSSTQSALLLLTALLSSAATMILVRPRRLSSHRRRPGAHRA